MKINISNKMLNGLVKLSKDCNIISKPSNDHLYAWECITHNTEWRDAYKSKPRFCLE